MRDDHNSNLNRGEQGELSFTHLLTGEDLSLHQTFVPVDLPSIELSGRRGKQLQRMNLIPADEDRDEEQQRFHSKTKKKKTRVSSLKREGETVNC